MWFHRDKLFTESDIPDDVVGFVYCITDHINKKRYIGKKIFFNKVSKPPLKGKKKRRISSIPSDWQLYFGSSDELKKVVELSTDRDNDFRRDILFLCKNKNEMSYIETREIITRDALLREDFYNGWITAKISKRGLDGIDRISNLS